MAKTIDTINTERLTLRGIDRSDAEAIVKWRSDPGVFRYFRSVHKITLDEHLAWFDKSYSNNPDRFDWMCIDRSTSEKVGVFGLVRESGYAEVNYILALEAQHKGYATEAISAIIDYAHANWRIKKIIAEIHAENKPSIALAKRLGFSFEEKRSDFEIYSMELAD